MSIAELHPEHLLDKHGQGTLSESERATLEAHVAKCASCRFELEVRADFADEMANDAVRDSGLHRLVEVAAKTEVPKPAPAPAPERATTRRRSRLGVWLFAAAAMLVVAGAAASEAGRRVWVPIFIHDAAPVAPAPTETDLVQRKDPVRPTVVAPPPVETAPVETAPPPVIPPAILPPPPRPTPSALLDAESDARRRGDYDRVLAIHAELVAGHPASHEAQTSRVTVARMLLDRGDLQGALAGFDAYLANGSGELGEDAMAGRATALDRMGKKDEARAAWSALVDRYPDSTYAAHARARIEALHD
jgi:hypothetical protein